MKPNPSRARGIGVAAAVVTLGLAAVGAWLVVALPRRARCAEQRATLERAITDFHAQRWERPVLRGEPVDGNAFDAQVEAMDGPLAELEEAPFDDLARVLGGDPRPRPELRALVDRHADALARYRASTRRAWSWGDYPVEDGADAQEIPLIAHLRASHLLAAQAHFAEPAECVEIATDLLRLGQDRAAGRSLVPLMVRSAAVEDVSTLLPFCLWRGDADVRAQAARELGVLVAHPVPTGYTLEVEALTAGAMFSELLAPLDHLPTDGATFDVWWSATDALDAWELLAGDPASRRAFGADYPRDLADYAAWQSRVAASANPWVMASTPAFERFLRRDAATRTRMRMLWAMARIVAGEPEAILAEPELFDVQTGRPLERSPEPNRFELRGQGDEPGEVITQTIPRAPPPPPPE
ncbi:MAG: hypothetical protein H6719_28325 [Sandaracinaceae bacterium]|nr:hypothetical protein [Sandaracinaceae bacterium]